MGLCFRISFFTLVLIGCSRWSRWNLSISSLSVIVVFRLRMSCSSGMGSLLRIAESEASLDLCSVLSVVCSIEVSSS